VWRVLDTQSRQQTLTGSSPAQQDKDPAPVRRGDVIGRYVIVNKLGAGGMGVVYAAYDPELDRRVALKLLHAADTGATRTTGHRRLLREAQAMAKLSHPNVVTVHDAGEHAGRVYLALELVAGTTLREWEKAEPRTWRACVDIFAAAGDGLAAAHAKELVHRDFKPDNVMVSVGGRVRVMDFGLARPACSQPCGASTSHAAPLSVLASGAGLLAGTPAYMAPEQYAGLDVGPAADQFAYCVSLWEALYGERPFKGDDLADLALNVIEDRRRPPPSNAKVPAWLRRVCDRGLAHHPDDRFENMSALLRGLRRGQNRARVRRIGGAVFAVTAAIGAVALSERIERANAVEVCDATGAEIDEVWNDARRAELDQAIQSSGFSYAEQTAARVSAWLDTYAADWSSSRVEACLNATVERKWSARTLDHAAWCLDERKQAVDALVARLSTGAGASVQGAVHAVVALSRVEDCLNEEALESRLAPPDEDRIAVLQVRMALAAAVAADRTGAYASGLEIARKALRDAEVIGWPESSAASRLTLGQLHRSTGDFDEAEALLQRAFFDASRAKIPAVAGRAAVALTSLVGARLQRGDEGLRWSLHAEIALAGLPDPLQLQAASLLSARARVHWARGDSAEALPLLQEALSIQERALGPAHPGLANALNALGNTLAAMARHHDAQAAYERALSIREEALGTEHPGVASILANMGALLQSRGDGEHALTWHERALAIRERAFGPDHIDVAVTINNIAGIARSDGDFSRAEPLYRRALAIHEKVHGPDHPSTAVCLSNLAVVRKARGALAESEALQERALAITERALGPDHPNVAGILQALAWVRIAQGRGSESVPMLQRALAIREKLFGAKHPELVGVLTSLGSAAHATRAHATSRAAFERALSIWTEAGDGGAVLGLCHFGVARAALEMGDRDGAHEHAEKAVPLMKHGGSRPARLGAALFVLAKTLRGVDDTRAHAAASEALVFLTEAGREHQEAAHDVEAWLARPRSAAAD